MSTRNVGPLFLAGCTVCFLGAQGVRAAVYQVGPSRPFQTLAGLPALAPGDVVEVDSGTYNEVKRWRNAGTIANPIVLRGTGTGTNRPVFDASGKTVDGTLPNPRAVFQIEADNIRIENFEFRNARNGDNGAGIRVTQANNATIRNCRITLCDMGIMSDGNTNLLIESSEIASNGTALYDGFSHNLYLGGDSATLRYCYIHDALYGQNFKTRGHYTELLHNWISDSQDGEVGLVDAAETVATNSHAVMIGNVVISKPRLSGYNSGRFIQFGQDSGGQHNGVLFAFNNTFAAGDNRIQFLSSNASGGTVVAHNNIFFGGDKIVGTTGGGIAGSNNWMRSTATVPAPFFATIKGIDPGFANASGREFRLTSGSACRNQGLGPLQYLDGTGLGHPGQPGFEYVPPVQGRPRSTDGQLDIGAFEHGAPVLQSIKIDGKDCVLDFTAEASGQYELQQTTDLASRVWIPVITNLQGTSPIHVIDTNGAGQARRFYRVKTAL